MLRPGAMHLFSFPVKRKLKVSVMCTENKNLDFLLLSPLKVKIILLITLMRLMNVRKSSQARKPPRHWGKLLIFYWWTWLSKHNKNRLGVIACWKSRWQSEAKLHPAVWNFKLHQFEALLMPQARFPLRWRRQGRRTLYSWAEVAVAADWCTVFYDAGRPESWKGDGLLLSQVLEYDLEMKKNRQVPRSLGSHQP